MNSQDFVQQFPFMGRRHTFYHVGIKQPDVPWFLRKMQAGLENYLTSLNGDWFRYATLNYVVWTDLAAIELANGIRAVNGLEHLITLVTPFEPAAANGYMPQEFWQWLNKVRFPGQGFPGVPNY